MKIPKLDKKLLFAFAGYWLLQPIISFSWAYFALFFTGLGFGVLLTLSLRKISIFLLPLWIITIVLAGSTLQHEIRKEAGDQKCFKFGVSYPGTESFDNCYNSITFSDYYFAFKR